MSATWRKAPVPGYEISSDGQVRSMPRQQIVRNRWGTQTVRTLEGRLLTPQRFPNGYLGVHLGRGKCHLVHRLVAVAFVPGDTEMQVNHKNGNRADNRAENLEWLTCADNHRHSYRELSRRAHALTQPVQVGGVRYPSERAAAKTLGVVPGSVRSAVVKGHRVRGQEAYRV